MIINNIECSSVTFEAADYANANAIVIMLCKECAAALGKLPLPADVEAATKAYVAEYSDIYGVGTINTLTVMRDGKLQQVLLAGCGEGKNCTPDNFRKSVGCAVRMLHKLNCEKAVIFASILANPKRAHYLEALAEGLYLGAYQFNEYKSDAKEVKNCSVAIANNIENADAALHEAAVISCGVSYTRNLVNRPGNDVTPQVMAEEAAKAAAELNLEIEVLDENQLAAKGMNSILAVGQGSVHKPRMITLKYRGAGDAPFTAYVGKGITFDSGGISIKPSENMGEMKDDMAGAGAVLGAIKTIARLGLPCNVMAVLACAENMPGGNAQRPGDIVRAGSGKTIEVINTDAEGRMVLADGVWYACRQGAARVIDIATLTGAVIIALGNETAGIITNDDELAASLKDAGKLTGESLWQLPALPDCKEALKSDVADLLNSAGRAGGCITGGLFIGEFVDEGTPWAHIDIGGTSTSSKVEGYKVKGGTGFGVRTLVNFAKLGK